MDRRRFLLTALAGSFAKPRSAGAQQAGKVYRIGYIGAGSPTTAGHHASAFVLGLPQRGYLDGQNIRIEYRWAEGNLERLPALVAEVVALKVDAIVSSATPAIAAAKKQTRSIPIVMAGVTDPVGSGFVATLARPGGNVTGLTHLSPDLAGKKLEFLKEVVPGLLRVAVLWNPNHPGQSRVFKDTQLATQALRLTLVSLEARNQEELDTVLAAVGKEPVQGLLELTDPLTVFHRRRITAAATRYRLPAMYSFREFVDAGGLMSYGTDFADLFRRGATYVYKILEGANPADLPVEQPTKFELVVNLRTAKALGLTIPPSLLLRADQVIE